MFSSSYSANPFLHLPLPPSPLLGQNIFLHDQLDLLESDLVPPSYDVTATISSMAASNKHQRVNYSQSSSSLPARRKPGKKDRHSKIRTARGTRERRVRLSIDIAKKFFSLQDVLGFDKASKTLDWLLTKSQASIKELKQMKHGDGAVLVSGSSEAAGNEGYFKRKKMKQSYDAAVQTRAEARARARERTREKMNKKRVSINSQELTGSVPRILNQSEAAMGMMASDPIKEPFSCLQFSQALRSDINNENPNVAKRNMKQSWIFDHEQQNLANMDVMGTFMPQLLCYGQLESITRLYNL